MRAAWLWPEVKHFPSILSTSIPFDLLPSDWRWNEVAQYYFAQAVAVHIDDEKLNSIHLLEMTGQELVKYSRRFIRPFLEQKPFHATDTISGNLHVVRTWYEGLIRTDLPRLAIEDIGEKVLTGRIHSKGREEAAERARKALLTPKNSQGEHGPCISPLDCFCRSPACCMGLLLLTLYVYTMPLVR